MHPVENLDVRDHMTANHKSITNLEKCDDQYLKDLYLPRP